MEEGGKGVKGVRGQCQRGRGILGDNEEKRSEHTGERERGAPRLTNDAERGSLTRPMWKGRG